MKIAIPVVNIDDHKYEIAPGFNVTPYMCIYDSKEGEYSWIYINQVLQKGENIAAFCKRNGLKAIIASIMKPMALNLFNNLDITVYKTDSTDLVGAVTSYEHDELRRYNALDALETVPACGSNCKSCSTASTCNN